MVVYQTSKGNMLACGYRLPLQWVCSAYLAGAIEGRVMCIVNKSIHRFQAGNNDIQQECNVYIQNFISNLDTSLLG